jgi:ABC-type dipeptide/oligopeptide/nickel transport system permease subunit
VLLFFALTAILAPVLAPRDPIRGFPGKQNLQPAWRRESGSVEGYLLGSDRFGRDVFSRLVYGARAAMFLALTAVPLAALIGVLVGVTAGYAGGWVEVLILRAADVFNGFPIILFTVLVVMILRDQPMGLALNGLVTLTIAFAAINWVSLARVLHPVVLNLKTHEFIEAAHALGASSWQIIGRHVLPNLSGLVAVWVVNAIPTVILMEAGLGYLGVELLRVPEGYEFQVTSWGGLFYEGRALVTRNPYVLLAPTVCVFLISFSFTLLAKYLEGRYKQNNMLDG